MPLNGSLPVGSFLPLASYPLKKTVAGRTGLRDWCSGKTALRYSTPILGRSHFSSSAEARDDNDCARHIFMRCALNAVESHGWTQGALEHAVKGIGLSPASASLYPMLEVGYHFMDLCSDSVIEKAQDMMGGIDDPEERFIQLLRCRIAMLYPYIRGWHNVMAMGVLSPVETSGRLGEFIDRALDVSNVLHDHDTLLRRSAMKVAFLTIYTSAEMFAATDLSYNLTETQDFLTRKSKIFFGMDSIVALQHAAGVSLLGALPSLGIGGTMFRTPFPPDEH